MRVGLILSVLTTDIDIDKKKKLYKKKHELK